MTPSARLRLLRSANTNTAGPSAQIGSSPAPGGIPSNRLPTRGLRAAAPPRILPYVEDREFLPPALGLAESPPSPIRIGLMLVICLMTAGALVWSLLARVDVLAIARGQIEPLHFVKVVQPADSGTVASVGVVDGQVVKAGDILIRLDSRIAEVELAAAAKIEVAANAEAARRAAAIAISRTAPAFSWIEPIWANDISPSTRLREDGVLRGEIGELKATLANLEDQRAEKASAVAQGAINIAAQNNLIATLTERVNMRKELIDLNVGSRAGLIDATQSLREAQTQLATEQGRYALASAALKTTQSERQKTVEAWLAEQTRRMSEARRLAEEKGFERARAQAHLDNLVLRAPVAGTVQNLGVTTLGQMVVAGQELMRIVPGDDRLVVRGYMSNDDIGFVVPGQEATIKVDAFPFTRFGTLGAHVASISRDAVPAAAAEAALADHAGTGERSKQTLTPTAKPMGDLVFATTLDLDDRPRTAGHLMVPRSGMSVTIEVKTGTRRMIDYVLSPLVEVASGSFHER